MEHLIDLSKDRPRLKVALFDFDGTLSTLRYGWERIMEPLMIEMIAGETPADEALVREVREYINESVGIQTIYQMQWLVAAVQRHGRNPGMPSDPWWYKNEYNKRLMNPVAKRTASIQAGAKRREAFLVKDSEAFLKALRGAGVAIFVASGTDHPDVTREAAVLGLDGYFTEIAGAPVGRADCSKEAVLKKLVAQHHLEGPEVIVIGDGKVEIALGRAVGAITLGVASDEDKLEGVNPAKRERLIRAGAHAIVGDYQELETIFQWLQL